MIRMVLIYFIILICLLPVAYGAIIGAPLLFVKKSGAKIMLSEASVKDGEVVYDLGAGTGRMIIMAKKDFNKNIKGIEIAPLIWLIGKLNLLFRGIDTKQLQLGNFYNLDFRKADVFFCFLTPKAMEKLKSKFINEAKKGSRIISYAFEIKDWQPKKVIREPNIPPIFIYEI